MERQRLDCEEGLQVNDEYELDDTMFLKENFLKELLELSKEIEKE